MGPFTAVALVGPVAVRLALTRKLQGLHLVFHVSLLRRYKPGGDGVEPPPPIVVDEEEEYNIEAYTFTPSLMRDQGVLCMLEGLQQQRRQLGERGRVGAQLGALGDLLIARWVTLMCFCCLAVYFGTWWLCLHLLPPTVGLAVDRYHTGAA